MAFLLRKPRIILCNSIPKSLAKKLHKSTADEVSSDAITEFTDELLTKRQLRWEIQQQKQHNEWNQRFKSKASSLKDVTNLINSMKRSTNRSVTEVMILSVDFEKLDEKHIDHLVVTACGDRNNEFIEKFVDQCIDANKVIGESSVLTICEYFCTLNDNRTLIKLIDLCRLNNKLVFDRHCEFKHYVARNLWEKGNSDGALTLLDEAYEQADTNVRTSILSIFRFIVQDTVSKKSEAVLHRLIKSATHLQQRLNEPIVLLYIWKTCFLSDWFSDQVIADELFGEHTEIRCNAVKSRGMLAYNALCSGQVDVVHRLIEAFLKFEMKEDCKLILELLFEYHYACRNLRACSEILKTTIELDIELSNTYNHKLLNLLMGGTFTITPKKHVIQKIDFKF